MFHLPFHSVSAAKLYGIVCFSSLCGWESNSETSPPELGNDRTEGIQLSEM